MTGRGHGGVIGAVWRGAACVVLGMIGALRYRGERTQVWQVRQQGGSVPAPVIKRSWRASSPITWFVILRMYQPHAEVIQAQWRCPAVRKVS
jgi:hypothetical protein